MATNYPWSSDSFPRPEDEDLLDNPNHADLHGQVSDAIEAIQDELGATPSSDYSTVAARLNKIESDVTNIVGSEVTKEYVDGLVQGLQWKLEVRAATTTNGTLSTDFEDGDTIDGVTLATGDRILIKNQNTASQNGIYVVAASGAPTRATDADAAGELLGAATKVLEGEVNEGTCWAMNTTGSIVVNTTSLVWVGFNGAGSITSGGVGTGLNANYPGDRPALPYVDDNRPALPGTHAADHNRVNLEVNAIGADLINAKGALPTLSAKVTEIDDRLDEIEAGPLDANAKVAVKLSGTLRGTRRAVNFIPGSNVTLTINDDAGNEEVDVTIASSGGGGGGGTNSPLSNQGEIWVYKTGATPADAALAAAGENGLTLVSNDLVDEGMEWQKSHYKAFNSLGGYKAQSVPMMTGTWVSNTAALTSGTMYIIATYIEAGVSVSYIDIVNGSGSAYSGAFYGWAAIYDDSRNLLVRTNDESSNGNFSTNVKHSFYVGEYFTDFAVTSGSTTVTSATANFTNADAGKEVNIHAVGGFGVTVPTSYTINSVTNSTTIVVDQALPGSGSNRKAVVQRPFVTQYSGIYYIGLMLRTSGGTMPSLWASDLGTATANNPLILTNQVQFGSTNNTLLASNDTTPASFSLPTTTGRYMIWVGIR